VDALGVVVEHTEDDAAEIEVFGDVVLTLLDCLVNVRHCLLQAAPVQLHDCSVVVEGRHVVVVELGEMRYAVGDRLNNELNILIFLVRLLQQIVLYSLKGQKQVRLRLTRNHR
jgi:hypothetical protein